MKMENLELSATQQKKYQEIRSKLETRLTDRFEDRKQFIVTPRGIVVIPKGHFKEE